MQIAQRRAASLLIDKETHMQIIGVFRKDEHDGFMGWIKTLYVDQLVALVRNDEESSNRQPDYLVHLDPEDNGEVIGAGWIRVSDNDAPSIVIIIDDPALAAPINARLDVCDEHPDIYHLHWQRSLRHIDAPFQPELTH